MNTRSRSATVGGMISASSGRTQTVQQQQEQEPQKSSVLVLKLKNKSSIQWTEDTVDNENLGRKSSKRCCIYHKSKAFGESDSDESDSDTEQAKAQPNKGRHPNYQRHHA